jgi:hypothetical protein
MKGYNSRTVSVTFSIDDWYFGNILFGSLIGMLIVEPATGAMWKLDTEFINETLHKSSASIENPSLKVLGFNDIPDDWKQNLIRLN